MSYSLNWHVEKRVLYLRLFNNISANEIIDCNQAALRYIREGTQPVHIVIDTLDITTYPNNLRWIIHMVQNNPTKAIGWRLVIADDHNLRVLLSTILSVLHVPIHSCQTVQEALDYLKQLDSPPLAATR